PRAATKGISFLLFASSGKGDRAERESRWRCATGLADTIRSGRLCSTNRLRQRGELAACAVSVKTKGDGGPRCAWRRASAACATIVNREFAALSHRRRRRAVVGSLGRQAAGGPESGQDRAHRGERRGRSRAWFHLHDCGARGTDRRYHSRASSV